MGDDASRLVWWEKKNEAGVNFFEVSHRVDDAAVAVR